MRSAANMGSAAIRFRVGVPEARDKTAAGRSFAQRQAGNEKENKRLKMENELLRDFLQSVERK